MPRELPIIMSADSINAILRGRKTQTRRVIKPQPPQVEAVRERCGAGFTLYHDEGMPERQWQIGGPVLTVRRMMGGGSDDSLGPHTWRCPYAVGDTLWVREKWCLHFMYDDLSPKQAGERSPECVGYVGGGHRGRCRHHQLGRWRSPLHMPRWASRMTLRVLRVRAEPLGLISHRDAIDEGVHLDTLVEAGDLRAWEAREIHARVPFSKAWDAVNAKRGFAWHTNPWVWAVRFEEVPDAPRT